MGRTCHTAGRRWAGHVIRQDDDGQDMSYGRTTMGRTCHTAGRRWAGNVIRQDMSYGRTTMIYPGQSSLVSREESAPEGDPGCVGKMEWSVEIGK